MNIVQFVAMDSPEDRLGQILESMVWTRKHVPHTKIERFKYFDGYWNALMKYWGQDDLVVIEQDILPLDRHIIDLSNCPSDFCTVPYDLGDGRLSIFEILEYVVDSVGATGSVGFATPKMQHHTRRVSNSTGSGLGLVKFSKHAQELIYLDQYPVPKHHWSLLDSWISSQMDYLGERWHVHYPEVGHLHFRY